MRTNSAAFKASKTVCADTWMIFFFWLIHSVYQQMASFHRYLPRLLVAASPSMGRLRWPGPRHRERSRPWADFARSLVRPQLAEVRVRPASTPQHIDAQVVLPRVPYIGLVLVVPGNQQTDGADDHASQTEELVGEKPPQPRHTGACVGGLRTDSGHGGVDGFVLHVFMP